MKKILILFAFISLFFNIKAEEIEKRELSSNSLILGRDLAYICGWSGKYSGIYSLYSGDYIGSYYSNIYQFEDTSYNNSDNNSYYDFDLDYNNILKYSIENISLISRALYESNMYKDNDNYFFVEPLYDLVDLYNNARSKSQTITDFISNVTSENMTTLTTIQSQVNTIEKNVTELQSKETTGDNTWLNPDEWRAEFVIDKDTLCDGSLSRVEIKALTPESSLYTNVNSSQLLYCGNTYGENNLIYWVCVGEKRYIYHRDSNNPYDYNGNYKLYEDSEYDNSADILFYVNIDCLPEDKDKSWFKPFATDVVWVYTSYTSSGEWEGKWHIITPNWVRSKNIKHNNED